MSFLSLPLLPPLLPLPRHQELLPSTSSGANVGDNPASSVPIADRMMGKAREDRYLGITIDEGGKKAGGVGGGDAPSTINSRFELVDCKEEAIQATTSATVPVTTTATPTTTTATAKNKNETTTTSCTGTATRTPRLTTSFTRNSLEGRRRPVREGSSRTKKTIVFTAPAEGSVVIATRP